MLSWIKREQSHKHSKSVDQASDTSITAPKSPVDVESALLNAADPLTALAAPVQAATLPPVSSGARSPGTAQLKHEEPLPSVPTEAERTLTTALNHPHDSVVAELHGHHPDHDVSARIDESVRAHTPLALQSADTLPTTPSEAPRVSPAPQESDKDKLFDPFTGVALGTFSPAPVTSQAREQLWTHLGRIRELQADIAQMHITMEGVGFDRPDHPLRLRDKRPRLRSGIGERLDLGASEGELGIEDDVGEEELMREERDREFERADVKFDGRKEGIDGIMGKACSLGELAQALATFHALETPTTDFSPRSSTMSSHAAAATLSMPTSPTSPTSPVSPSSISMSMSPSTLAPQSRSGLHAREIIRPGNDEFLFEGQQGDAPLTGAQSS
ncbi:hypothetical protein K488DRAFT_86852 [Vararia minispora EC-137]|uniref:Uncharacterized protein n=1 Tax=Vararia minispora EC-137 TaxID=1314806 RepID=A0ACB8QIH9_9AGAM|nr:hypothetical protein K488DRAFT_86852 [Vararia minispora EC-137]